MRCHILGRLGASVPPLVLLGLTWKPPPGNAFLRMGRLRKVRPFFICASTRANAPPRRDAPVAFDLPPLETARDAARAAGAVLEAVAAGDLTPTEGAHLVALVEAWRRALETSDLEARVAALEGGEHGNAPREG